MKLLLIAILMTSATSAFATGEGRYQIAVIVNDGDRWVVIDTKTGKTRLCVQIGLINKAAYCGPWSEDE